MNETAIRLDQTDQEMLTFEVSDEVLEAFGSTEGQTVGGVSLHDGRVRLGSCTICFVAWC